MNSSTSDSQIRDYTRRPKLYENVDGTAELFFGVMYCLGGWLGSEVESLMPAESFWGKGHPGHFVIMIWLGLVLGAGYWGTRAIKRRITFPRTGYVAQRQAKGSRVLFGVAAAAIGAAVVVLLALLGKGHHFEAGRIALLTFLVAPYAGFAVIARHGHPWKLAVAAGLALGLTAFDISGPHAPFVHWANLIVGLVWLASGGITLLLYIRRTRAPEPEAQ